HPAVLVFSGGSAGAGAETVEAASARMRAISRTLGVKGGVGLRPDVQCDEWRRHGALVLALWREMTYDARVGVPARAMAAPHPFRLPVPAGVAPVATLEAGGAVPLEENRFDLRYRALTLARLELEAGDALRVSLQDEAYRSTVLHWLA